MLLFGKKKKISKSGSKPDLIDKNGIHNSTHNCSPKPVLGIPLHKAVKNNPCFDGIPIPNIVRLCIDYVEIEGLNVEGIYRVSAPITKLDELEKLANNNGNIEFTDPHEAAGLLKRFLRQLPEHLLKFDNYDSVMFQNIADECICKEDSICSCNIASKLKEMIQKAPKENLYLLAYVFLHAKHVISKQSENKMTLGALGVLLQAMLSMPKNIVRIFMLNSAPDKLLDKNTGNNSNDKLVYFFDNIPFKRYIKPMTTTEIERNPPESYKDISEEIIRQTNLFNTINDEIILLRVQGSDTKQKEQEMWDVQHGITLLNRKLKALKKDSKEETDDEKETIKSDKSENLYVYKSGPRLEKHLLAIQKQLIDEIAEEQRQIYELTNRLHELQTDLNNHDDNLSSPSTPKRQKTPLAARPKMAPPPPPKPPILNVESVNNKIVTDGYLEEIDQSCDECHRQETRQQVLVEQISKIRDECAHLRSKLEESRENEGTIPVDAADDIPQPSVVVTKF